MVNSKKNEFNRRASWTNRMQPNEVGERCRGTATPVKDAGASEQGVPAPPLHPPPRGSTALLGRVGRGIRLNLHDNWPPSFLNWPHFCLRRSLN